MTEIIAFNKNELFDKMEEEEITSLYEIDNAGVKTITNNSSTVVLVNSTGEQVFYQKEQDTEIKTSKIKYCNEKQKLYFNTEIGKCYLDTFIRNNYGKVKI